MTQNEEIFLKSPLVEILKDAETFRIAISYVFIFDVIYYHDYIIYYVDILNNFIVAWIPNVNKRCINRKLCRGAARNGGGGRTHPVPGIYKSSLP